MRLLATMRQSDKEWQSPSIWYGATLPGWISLLARNNFAVSRQHLPTALTATGMSVLNSGLGLTEKILYGGRVRKVQLEDPVFVIGHWRTGTTFLHELLALDPRHTFPNTYECFIPNHFLLTEEFAVNNLGFLLPKHRPMDNMAAGLERPFEDEFALMNMGLPSPYLHLAFPGRNEHADYVDLDNLSEWELRRWKRVLLRFMRRVAYLRPGRLILKTPAHSCRIEPLLELFPNARFIHTVRNPFDVFPSMLNLWRKVCALFTLEELQFEGLEEFVFDLGDTLYKKLEETRHLIPAGNFMEVRYEELTANPVSVLKEVYGRMRLGDFEVARPKVEAHVAGLTGYRRNRFEMSAEMQVRVRERRGWIMDRYNYQKDAWEPHDDEVTFEWLPDD